MDNSLLVTLAILAITALSRWLQKKGENEEPGSLGDEWKTLKPKRPEPPPPRTVSSRKTEPTTGPPPQRRPGIDWEKELRRLLQGDAPSAPPPLPPPPIVQQSAPAPPSISPTPKPKMARAAVSAGAGEGPSFTVSTLAESTSAYQKAQQLHEKVAGRLRKIDELTELHKPDAPGHARKVLPEIVAVVSQLQSSKTARQAIVASIILGPPKALELSPFNPAP